MIIQISSIILVLFFAWLQMKQGLFSCLIMLFCCMVAATVALTTFPAVAAAVGLYSLQPALANSVTVAALFIATLLILRILFDKFIHADIHMPYLLERIGGGALGVIIGMILVGMVVVVMHLLPTGRVILGDYRPFHDTLLRNKTLQPFRPDDFVVGLAGLLADGSMSRNTTTYPDLLLDAFCARNTAGLQGRVDTPPDAMAIEGAWQWSGQDLPLDPTAPRGVDSRTIVIRTAINAAASGEDDWWRLPGTHFRLRGDDGRSYYPLAYLIYEGDFRAELPVMNDNDLPQPALLVVERPLDAGVYGDDKYGRGKIPEDQINLRVDWVWRLPVGVTPVSLTFRQIDRQPIPAVQGELPEKKLKDRALTVYVEEDSRRR
jgi:hypothetical protein